MDWNDLFANREQFPDETVVQGPNGTTLTLGELRKQFGRVADFTKYTQQVSEERRALQTQLAQTQQQLQAREAALAQAQSQFAAALQARGESPAAARGDDLAAYREDPTFRPLVALVDAQRAAVAQLEQRLQQVQARLHQDEIAVNAWRYQQQLEALRQRDPHLNPAELVQYAQELYTKPPDLEALYRARYHDRIVEQKVKEAEQRAYERAKAERPAPPMPGSRPRTAPASTPPLPASLEERVDLLKQDPALMEELEVGLAELRGPVA